MSDEADQTDNKQEPPDWEALAERWMQLWQDGLSDLAQSQDMAQMMAGLLSPLTGLDQARTWLSAIPDSPARDQLQAQIDELQARIDQLSGAGK